MKHSFKDTIKTQKFRLYLLSFLIPVIAMMAIFIKRDVYPFGDESFLHIDMYHQYYPFLSDMYYKLRDGESLLYSWNAGIGSNFLALFVYYLSTPTNWLCVLFPERLLLEFQTYMVVIKVGLCGLTFAHYLCKHFKTESYMILFFSGFYALSGYMAAYNWNVMWLDVLVLSPLVILGIERLVEEGDGKLYAITLALSIFTNYYIAMLLCIYLVLYFILLVVTKDVKGKDLLKAFIRFAIYSLFAGAMAAILVIPEYRALQYSEFTKINFPQKNEMYFAFSDMLARHAFNVTVHTGLDHWPNVYCGVGVFFLLPLYLLHNEIPLKEKIAKLLLLGFLLLSFAYNKLNFMWHGFNWPDSLPARQSYLYIILLLTVCFEACYRIKEITKKELLLSLACALVFLGLAEKIATDEAFNNGCFTISGIFVIVYALGLLLYQQKGKLKIVTSIVLLVIVSFEAGYNTYITSCPVTSRSAYFDNYEDYKLITQNAIDRDGDLFRFEKFARKTNNDAMMIGFPSASYFSSVNNALVKNFYTKWGLKTSKVYYSYEGYTPVTSALLGIRYMLYTLDKGYDDLYYVEENIGNLYRYRCNFSLPLGYMIPYEYVDMEGNFCKPDMVKELLKNGSNNDYNPIELQNLFVSNMGVQGDVFKYVSSDQNGPNASFYTPEDGHYYAYTSNNRINDIQFNSDTDSKKFDNMGKRYIMDLGYHNEGEFMSLTAQNGENINMSIYKVEIGPLAQFVRTLGEQTLNIASYDSTNIKGSVDVAHAGELVMSVSYEPGWTLYVDGVETTPDLFEDCFISVFLDEGHHEIELKYFPAGFGAGIALSIISIIAFIALLYFKKKGKIGLNF